MEQSCSRKSTASKSSYWTYLQSDHNHTHTYAHTQKQSTDLCVNIWGISLNVLYVWLTETHTHYSLTHTETNSLNSQKCTLSNTHYSLAHIQTNKAEALIELYVVYVCMFCEMTWLKHKLYIFHSCIFFWANRFKFSVKHWVIFYFLEKETPHELFEYIVNMFCDPFEYSSRDFWSFVH